MAFVIGVRKGRHKGVDVAWGAIHIFARAGLHPGEDPQYEELLSKVRGNRDLYALRHVYLLQAVTLWFVGMLIWAVGLFFEAVARVPALDRVGCRSSHRWP